MDLTLGQIVENLDRKPKPEYFIPVQSVSTDSRTLTEGALFFAIRGERFDGHDFIQNAFAKGACGAVVDKKWLESFETSGSFFLIPVSDTLKALQDTAAFYRSTFDIPVIGVTGTNGKTTVKEMIAAVLSTRCRVMKSQGNLNNHIGLALSIFSWKRNGKVAVLEMGTNHFGEIRRLCEIAKPTHGVITNIGKGHLEFFNDLEGVVKAKGELLESLTDGGEAFINGDDPYLFPLRHLVENTTTYGLLDWCDIRGRDMGCDEKGFPILAIGGQEIKLPVIGKHNLCNALAAVAVGRSFGVGWLDIAYALETYTPVDKRMEIESISDITIINDTYNANPSSVEQSLITLHSMQTRGRKIAVFGDMLELGDSSYDEHCVIGKWVYELKIDLFFCFGDQMENACLWAADLGMQSARHFDSKSKLTDGLLEYLKPGDTVLVKGSRGMKMEEIVHGLKKCLQKSNRE